MVKRFRRPRHGPRPFVTLRDYKDQTRRWQVMTLDRSSYERIKGARVKVFGKLAATLYRERGALRVPVLGAPSLAPGIGHCSSTLIADVVDGSETLKVVCESPFDLPPTIVTLVHPGSGNVWTRGLGTRGRRMPYPTEAWLSPLNRSQAYFQVVEKARDEDLKWVVPRDFVSQAEIELVAAERTGCTILRYEMRDLDLQEFEVKRVPQ